MVADPRCYWLGVIILTTTHVLAREWLSVPIEFTNLVNNSILKWVELILWMELETSVSMSSDNYDTEGFSAQPPWVSTVYNRYQAPCSGRICAESMVLLHYFLFD